MQWAGITSTLTQRNPLEYQWVLNNSNYTSRVRCQMGSLLAGTDYCDRSNTSMASFAACERQALTALCAPLQIVSEAQWKTMSAADFASYKAIILGDPNITPANASVVSSAGNTVKCFYRTLRHIHPTALVLAADHYISGPASLLVFC